jgi:hypothetical protein
MALTAFAIRSAPRVEPGPRVKGVLFLFPLLPGRAIARRVTFGVIEVGQDQEALNPLS